MTSGTDRAAPAIRRPAWIARLLTGLLGTPLNTFLTLATLGLVVWTVPPLARWALFDATWSGTAADCAAASGACWTFVTAKFRFILFAFYPPGLQWRPLLVMLLLLALLAVTALPRFWRPGLLLAWPLAVVLSWTLMSGAIVAPAVPSNQWGGLPITLLVWAVCFAAAVPLAVLLALARRSGMGGLRSLAILFIELMRGTPMVAILYIAMLILPMAVPGGEHLDKTLRAMIMIALFWSAYIAEVVRGGLQTVPSGQEEAAAALGFGYWRTMQLIVLPQAFRAVIPGMVNLAIGFLLATSLLAVIGIFDLLNAARASATDPQWLGFYEEAYLVVAIVYFLLCFAGSRYSRWLERYLGSATAGTRTRDMAV